jgi:hypothetical protein
MQHLRLQLPRTSERGTTPAVGQLFWAHHSYLNDAGMHGPAVHADARSTYQEVPRGLS